MFSKQLFATLSLLVLAASSALAAPPLQCPAPTTVTVAASSAAASDAAASSSAIVSSAEASATSIGSGKNSGKEGNGRGSGGQHRNGNHGKGKGGNNGIASTSAASATDAISATDSVDSSTDFASATDSIDASSGSVSATDSIAASSTDIASSVVTSDASGATETLSVGGGSKGAKGSGLESSAIASATSDATGASATAAPPAASSGSASSDDAQSALTLDPAVIATGFALDGQQDPTEGQVPSLTSTNNFINFCLTVNKPITNGQQIQTGSCNPAPMGVIAARTNMPSSKFAFPKNNDTIPADQLFTIQMAIKNLETGNFVNAASNYYSAPQQVNAQGDIIGHTHVVIEQLDSLDQTTVTDPTKFAFFKGVNGAAVNGVVTAEVTNGLPAGAYRLASINAAANHQPVLVAVAQHGSLDDMVYFTVQ